LIRHIKNILRSKFDREISERQFRIRLYLSVTKLQTATRCIEIMADTRSFDHGLSLKPTHFISFFYLFSEFVSFLFSFFLSIFYVKVRWILFKDNIYFVLPLIWLLTLCLLLRWNICGAFVLRGGLNNSNNSSTSSVGRRLDNVPEAHPWSLFAGSRPLPTPVAYVFWGAVAGSLSITYTLSNSQSHFHLYTLLLLSLLNFCFSIHFSVTF